MPNFLITVITLHFIPLRETLKDFRQYLPRYRAQHQQHEMNQAKYATNWREF